HHQHPAELHPVLDRRGAAAGQGHPLGPRVQDPQGAARRAQPVVARPHSRARAGDGRPAVVGGLLLLQPAGRVAPGRCDQPHRRPAAYRRRHPSDGSLDRPRESRPVTTFRSVLEEACRPENRAFLAPTFQVRIDGENLPRNVLRDVLELKYIDGLTEIDRFELSLNNWDPAARGFKFIGSEPRDYMSGGDEATRLFRLFQPCEKTVDIRLGYADSLLT